MVVGWIKLHRKFLEWEWYTDSKMVHLFIHLLLSASIEDRKWKGIVLQRGQLATTVAELSKKTGLTARNLRTCIDKLEECQIIDRQTTNKYTLITICNYESYQAREDDSRQTSDNPPTIHRQTSDKRLTNAIAEEVKKLDNDRISINNNNNTVSINNNRTHTREGFSFYELSKEEQQAERNDFYRVFFWANVFNPRAEVQKFIRHNERHSWRATTTKTVFATPSERKALAEEWAANEKCRKARAPDFFLNVWWQLWRRVEKEHPELEPAILDTRNDFKLIQEIQTVVFYCHKHIRQYFEEDPEGQKFLDEVFPGYKIEFSKTPLKK